MGPGRGMPLEEWGEKSRRRSYRFGIGDLLIWGIAFEAGAAAWSLDGDFGRMEKLGSLKTHRPPPVG